ncbi:hypothetical protein EHS13_20215 [Paenibacillus psychroresistens]|uniref:Uncharacterized protein n=1 Tax=Paenibacillus psychroresistens TaxID=1778678 RepID=A0A6B8RMP7_9BACL|nr:hypothetical protein [Paenibacillus psychroresistens]QGQ97044.1 hypothetical protein EHS13_20215 [Paenibacillus psychroresistens]
MTAEIAVLNRFGVALAADSAVTVGSNKIFNSADKLFALSKIHPVGIMVYGNAHYMNVPWETVVKIYRKHLGDQAFPTLKGYCDHFFDYINTDARFTSPESEKQMVGNFFSVWLEEFLKNLNLYIANTFTHEPTEQEVQIEMLSATNDLILEYNALDYANTFDDSFNTWFNQTYSGYIALIFNDNVNIQTTPQMIDNLVYIAGSLVCRNYKNDGRSGIVIAGFGEDDIFPSLYGYRIEGIFNGIMKYAEEESSEIGAGKSAEIVPFAQQEMVHSFLTGMDPKIESEIHQFLHETVNIYPDFVESLINQLVATSDNDQIKAEITQKGIDLFTEFSQSLQQLKRRNYLIPVIQTVASFPKEELAAMAEALVNLTSIKRKVTNQAETVGGPTDVAVISKGDGFIWIKRKHYFSPEFNSQYFNNLVKG